MPGTEIQSAEGLGATLLANGSTRFVVWAPLAQQVQVRTSGPDERLIPMERDESGYHRVEVDGLAPGALYMYQLDGKVERPDPASRSQPRDVHGPSLVVPKDDFPWSDQGWPGLLSEDYIFYELHVGTFSPEGSFDGVLARLPYLKELGVTAIQLMPVTQFPGTRNWGYDGVYPYAVHAPYGGAEGLKRLVDGCHRVGLAVALDVVYNHLGPEGNYLRDFGPYFTDRYQTPWGEALNYDGPGSDHVRRFFLENALQWVTEFHVDALRLDAVHAMYDHSARHFLQELAESVHEAGRRLNRRVHVIAESDLNDPRLIRPVELGGYGLDGQWADDFHHALHVLLTGERKGYYQDFGTLSQMAEAFRRAYVYSGQYSPYRGRRHGAPSYGCLPRQFVVFSQNHDQVGNRMAGERLRGLVTFEATKLEAGVLLLSPFLPLLFMGQEYGEEAPFQYFISHLDEELVEAVREGRRAEFSGFQWQGETPDPQAESTFNGSRLRMERRHQDSHRTLFRLYRELIRLRKELPALGMGRFGDLDVTAFDGEGVICLRRGCDSEEAMALFNFSREEARVMAPLPAGVWSRVLDFEEDRWDGSGRLQPETLDTTEGGATLGMRPLSFALYSRENRDPGEAS